MKMKIQQPNMWNTASAVLRGQFIALNNSTGNEVRSEVRTLESRKSE
jgi:hypothetical protein